MTFFGTSDSCNSTNDMLDVDPRDALVKSRLHKPSAFQLFADLAKIIGAESFKFLLGWIHAIAD